MMKPDAYTKALLKKKKKFESGICWVKVWNDFHNWLAQDERPYETFNDQKKKIRQLVEAQLKSRKKK